MAKNQQVFNGLIEQKLAITHNLETRF